jgi:hypothetical protein
MLGAIAGDVIGSVYEGKKAWQRVRTPHFEPMMIQCEGCSAIMQFAR